jgi:cytochrome b561
MDVAEGYSRRQIWLHWIIFALVVWQYVLHEPITEAWDVIEEGGTASPGLGVFAHVAGGVLILALMVWRIALRLREGAPPAPADEHPALRLLSGVTHWGLYALLFLMPVSGAAAWFAGAEAAAEGHSVMRVVLLSVLALHVAGALAHRFVFRSGVMERMLRAAR